MKKFITTSAVLTCLTILATKGLHAEDLCYEDEFWEAPPAPCEVVDPCFDPCYEPPVRPCFIGVPTYLPAPPIYRPFPRSRHIPRGPIYAPRASINPTPDIRRHTRPPYRDRDTFRNGYQNPREQARGPYIPQGDPLRQPFEVPRYRQERLDRDEHRNDFVPRPFFAPEASASTIDKEDSRSKKRSKKEERVRNFRRNLISLLLN